MDNKHFFYLADEENLLAVAIRQLELLVAKKMEVHVEKMKHTLRDKS